MNLRQIIIGVGTAAGQRIGIIAVAGLALLLSFGRNRLQTLVDRLLYGQRRDPYAVVQRVGQRLDTAAGPVEALAGLIQLFEQARYSLHPLDDTARTQATAYLTTIQTHLAAEAALAIRA